MRIEHPAAAAPAHCALAVAVRSDVEDGGEVVVVAFGEQDGGRGSCEGLEGDDDGAFFEVEEFRAEGGVHYRSNM